MHWLGASTQTSVVIVYRASADSAACYVVVNDIASATQTSDTSVDDGLLRFEVAGLTAETTYSYSVFEAGVQVANGTCETMPNAGTEWSICYLSCWAEQNEAGMWVKDVIDAHDPPVKLVIFQGDTPYSNAPSGAGGTFYGEALVGSDVAIDALITAKGLGVAGYDYTDATNAADVRAVMDTTHRVFRRCPGVRNIIERYATLWQASDHEYPGNDVDRGDITTINEAETLVANTTQLSDLMDICRDSYNGYHKGNPGNTEANADGAFSEYYQAYWRHEPTPDIDIVSVSTWWDRDSSPAAKADRILFGATQLTWLAATLAERNTKYKLVTSPNPALGLSLFAEELGPHPQTADGSDNGERDTFFKTLDDFTGVTVIAGDVHHSHYSTHNGVTCFCISPISATQNTGTAANNAYNTGARWWNNTVSNGTNSIDDSWDGQLGFVDVGPDALTMRAYLGRNGHRTFGTIAVGSNDLVTAPNKVGAP